MSWTDIVKEWRPKKTRDLPAVSLCKVGGLQPGSSRPCFMALSTTSSYFAGVQASREEVCHLRLDLNEVFSSHLKV